MLFQCNLLVYILEYSRYQYRYNVEGFVPYGLIALPFLVVLACWGVYYFS